MLFRCSASEFKQRLIIETTGLKRDFQSPSVFASRCDFTERQTRVTRAGFGASWVPSRALPLARSPDFAMVRRV